MLNWLSRFNIFCFLDDQDYAMPIHDQECIASAGVYKVCSASRTPLLSSMGEFVRTNNDWIFGHIGYGLKTETIGVSGGPADPIGFDPVFFFVPLYVLIVRGNELQIGSLVNDHDEILSDIMRAYPLDGRQEKITIESRITRKQYIETIEKLRSHILRGDCYEINFCRNFFQKIVGSIRSKPIINSLRSLQIFFLLFTGLMINTSYVQVLNVS